MGNHSSDVSVEFPEDQLSHPGIDTNIASIEMFAIVMLGAGGQDLSDGDDACGYVG